MFTISAAAAALTTYLATKLKENKAVTDFLNDFTTATVDWIKPIFLKPDGTIKKAVEELQNNPDDKAAQQKVQTLIEFKVEDDPNGEAILKEIIAKITEITGKSPLAQENTINADNNQGVILQNATAGNIHIGDRINQKNNQGTIVMGDHTVNNNHYGGKPINPANQSVWKIMLAEGKTKQAIAFLLEENKADTENCDDLNLILSRYNLNEQSKNRGIITNEEYKTTVNQITNSLLKMFG